MGFANYQGRAGIVYVVKQGLHRRCLAIGAKAFRNPKSPQTTAIQKSPGKPGVAPNLPGIPTEFLLSAMQKSPLNSTEFFGIENPRMCPNSPKAWSAANGGLRDGGLSKSEDIRGKRHDSSVFCPYLRQPKKPLKISGKLGGRNSRSQPLWIRTVFRRTRGLSGSWRNGSDGSGAGSHSDPAPAASERQDRQSQINQRRVT